MYSGMVVDSVDAEGIGEFDEIEAIAEIDAARERRGDLEPCPEGTACEGDCVGAERPKLLENDRGALQRNWLNKAFFGSGISRWRWRWWWWWWGVGFECEVSAGGRGQFEGCR